MDVYRSITVCRGRVSSLYPTMISYGIQRDFDIISHSLGAYLQARGTLYDQKKKNLIILCALKCYGKLYASHHYLGRNLCNHRKWIQIFHKDQTKPRFFLHRYYYVWKLYMSIGKFTLGDWNPRIDRNLFSRFCSFYFSDLIPFFQT